MTYVKVRPLTEGQARKAYEAVCKAYGETAEPGVFEQGGGGPSWPTGPLLVKDFALWSSPSRWAIVWEGGPFEWAINITERVAFAPIVFGEAISSFALGLYRNA